MKIGITERGDAGLDFSWINKVDSVDGLICISKASNNDLIENLIKYKDKIIYHSTCTGLGSTVLEPNVPTMEEKLNHVKTLIEKEFPISHIVIRIDPLIPIATGNFILQKDYLKQIELILKFCIDYDLRVRYSYIDMYNHVIERFKKNNIPINFFSKDDALKIQNLFSKYPLKYMSCGELYTPQNHKIGCVSEEDFKILGLDINQCTTNQHKQRKTCLCCSAKTELLNNKHPCKHGCIYCYWKN